MVSEASTNEGSDNKRIIKSSEQSKFDSISNFLCSFTSKVSSEETNREACVQQRLSTTKFIWIIYARRNKTDG